MARVDKDRFPKLIIHIPAEQFPDKLNIVITGNNRNTPNKTTQLIAQSADEALGSPLQQGGLPPDHRDLLVSVFIPI